MDVLLLLFGGLEIGFCSHEVVGAILELPHLHVLLGNHVGWIHFRGQVIADYLLLLLKSVSVVVHAGRPLAQLLTVDSLNGKYFLGVFLLGHFLVDLDFCLQHFLVQSRKQFLGSV